MRYYLGLAVGHTYGTPASQKTEASDASISEECSQRDMEPESWDQEPAVVGSTRHPVSACSDTGCSDGDESSGIDSSGSEEDEDDWHNYSDEELAAMEEMYDV
jgi:hypothetical protein